MFSVLQCPTSTVMSHHHNKMINISVIVNWAKRMFWISFKEEPANGTESSSSNRFSHLCFYLNLIGGVGWDTRAWSQLSLFTLHTPKATVRCSVLPFNFRLIGDAQPWEPWKPDSETLCNQAEHPDLALAVGFWKFLTSPGPFSCFSYMLSGSSGSIGPPPKKSGTNTNYISVLLYCTFLYPMSVFACVNMPTYIYTYTHVLLTNR